MAFNPQGLAILHHNGDPSMNLRQALHRLLNLFRRNQLDRDLQAEIQSHISLATEENLKSGLSPQESRRRALIQFGGTQQAKESARDQQSLPFVETLFQDLRFSARLLRKSPTFTAIAVLTLALGIGATTAIFSVVYGVLLRPLPYKNPQQLVRLWEQSTTGGRMNAADPNFLDLRAQSHSLSGLAEYHSGLATVTGLGDATRIPAATVSRDFFSIMDVQPVLGRGFVLEEQQLDAPVAALVSYSYWKQTLGSTNDLSSVHLKIDDKPASVVGVLPPGFRFPDNSDIWIPREITQSMPSRSGHNWSLIGRLLDGVPVSEARVELSAIAQKLKQQYGEDTITVAIAVDPLREAMTSDVRPGFLILLGASAFLLLIACSNVVNLMLSHVAGRERELSMRAALGAQRSRLIRQFLTESFLLSLLGGAFGIFLAYGGLNALLALAPQNLPRLQDVSLNSYVLLFTLVTVFAISIAMGLFTALRTVIKDAHFSLNEGSRAPTGTVSKQKLGRLIAAAQLAMALVLLVGATLLGRSLLRVLSTNSGFRTENILTMNLQLPADPGNTQRIEFLNNLLAKLHQIPGVSEVGGTNELPLSGSGFADGYYLPMNPGGISPGVQDLIRRSAAGDLAKDPALLAEFTKFLDEIFREKSRLGDADFVIASDGFFKALDIPLLEGRLFDDRDTIDSPHVALISQSLAYEKWPNQSPIGRSIEFGNMDGDLRLLTVIGVVGDVRDHTLEVAPNPTIYVNYRQRPRAAWQFNVVMRSSANPDSVFAAARSILHDLDPNIPPTFRTLPQVYSASLAARHFSLTLVAIFSATSLLLALAGIYGVFSYFVAQRTREIGVRMALGASSGEVLIMVLKQGAITAAIGIAVGLAASVVLTRLMQSQLFEISPTDPLTLLSASLLLILVSIAACAVPALRATHIDPVTALRCD
jgi:putative ABC transport system permease protein